MTTPIYHKENWPRKKTESKVECSRLVVNSGDSKTACRVSSLLSLPQASKHLPSTKSPSIPQENTHYSLPLRLTASPRVTLKHCSLSQKTLQSSGRAGSIEPMLGVFSPPQRFSPQSDMIAGPFSTFWRFIFEGPTTLQAQPQVYQCLCPLVVATQCFRNRCPKVLGEENSDRLTSHCGRCEHLFIICVLNPIENKGKKSTFLSNIFTNSSNGIILVLDAAALTNIKGHNLHFSARLTVIASNAKRQKWWKER